MNINIEFFYFRASLVKNFYLESIGLFRRIFLPILAFFFFFFILEERELSNTRRIMKFFHRKHYLFILIASILHKISVRKRSNRM